MLQTAILAGGLGTRVRGVAPGEPKSLIPICGRPFIEWQLEWLANNGVEEVALCLGHLGERIQHHVKDGKRFGLRVEYSYDGSHPLGTAGAIRRALTVGVLRGDFLVLYGDSYLDVAIDDVVRSFLASGMPALMTIFKNDGLYDRSNAAIVDGVLVYDKEDPPRPAPYIDYGLSVLSPRACLDGIPDRAASDVSSLFRDLSRSGLLAFHIVERRFYEIGSPAGILEIERVLCTA